MEQLGSIVVGTDGSDTAQLAVDRAGAIAHALGVSVHIVSGYRGSPSQMAHRDDQGRAHAEKCVADAQLQLKESGVECELHAWSGDPAEGLVQIAEQEQAQMIVVGNRGMTGARRILGSVPNSVAHSAKCSVLIVPTG
jgi:nucleotide-binding universal stress UspA family protein